MNSEHDNRLEAVISRELKGLPELAAPDSLAARVMAVIEQEANVPWYRRSWQSWSAGIRATSFAALLVLFGGLCFGGWELSHAEAATAALHRAGEWLSGLNTIGNTLAVLANSTVLIIKKLGTGFMIGCLLSMSLAYAMCVGLGTMCVRLAFTKRQGYQL
jgi:hypothetical protein